MSLLTKRRIWFMSGTFVVLIIITEILLRTLWGFGSMVLFSEDPQYEYLAMPNQEHTRFGNRIYYNEFAMRSNPISKSDSCIVLGFGDSVINGGTLTDQDSLATSKIEKHFDGRMRFLNVSAGSWGPDNCAAYLKKYGDFGARMIVLFVSSHDAHDNMAFDRVVGVDPSYPNQQYPLALIEVVDKYIIPRVNGLFGTPASADNLMINKNGQGFNTGFDALLNYSKKSGIPFLICLHAERAEVENGAINSQGMEILQYCERNNITVINGLSIGEKVEFYRDEIHMNDKGQAAWVKPLSQEIIANLKSCIN